MTGEGKRRASSGRGTKKERKARERRTWGRQQRSGDDTGGSFGVGKKKRVKTEKRGGICNNKVKSFFYLCQCVSSSFIIIYCCSFGSFLLFTFFDSLRFLLR